MSIKISSLTPIDAANINAATTSIVPLVTGDGTLTTFKSNLSEFKKFIALRPVLNLGSVSGNVNLNYNVSNYQVFELGGNVSLSVNNWPTSGNVGEMEFRVNVTNTSRTLQFPANTTINTEGVVGLLASTRTLEFANTGTYTFSLSTLDSGSSIRLDQDNISLRSYNNSTQIQTANTGTVSIATTYTFYSPGTSEYGTATLGNGVAGLTKIVGNFGSNTYNVSVGRPAWTGGGGTAGSMRFNNTGSTATLLWSSGARLWIVIATYGNVSFT